MAIKALTLNPTDPNGRFYAGQVYGTATANKLVNGDTTGDVKVKPGVYDINISAKYVKGSSTDAKIDLVIDGITRTATTAGSTDGAFLTATLTGQYVGSTISGVATITGTATGASLDNTLISAIRKDTA